GGQRRDPGLPLGIAGQRLRCSPAGAGEAGATCPLALVLQIEEPSAPPHLGDSGALPGHLLLGGIGEVAQHLPPDRRITVQEPVGRLRGDLLDWGHRGALASGALTCAIVLLVAVSRDPKWSCVGPASRPPHTLWGGLLPPWRQSSSPRTDSRS